jgi:8-oxo-dGTP diphosphatase
VADDDSWKPPTVLLTVDLVILTLRRMRLQVLLIERGTDPYEGAVALPGGFLRDVEEDIEGAARRELAEEAGLAANKLHLEQFGVYGSPGRDPRGRVISVAFLAISPGLPEPEAGTDAADARWVLADEVLSSALPLAFDHQRIVADGVARARSKLERTSLATAFCGPVFTLAELQQVYEAVWGVRLDPRNFYRKIQSTRDFIIPVGLAKKTGAGRPARLFRAGPGTAVYPPMLRSTSGPAQQGHRKEEVPWQKTMWSS